jgi:hypothetical protein
MADSDPCPYALRFPEWEAQYKAALLETNHDKLPKFITAAETAIRSRLQGLAGNVDHGEERASDERFFANPAISQGFYLSVIISPAHSVLRHPTALATPEEVSEALKLDSLSAGRFG